MTAISSLELLNTNFLVMKEFKIVHMGKYGVIYLPFYNLFSRVLLLYCYFPCKCSHDLHCLNRPIPTFKARNRRDTSTEYNNPHLLRISIPPRQLSSKNLLHPRPVDASLNTTIFNTSSQESIAVYTPTVSP